jgi:tRNA G10  N-methylase Trm11
MIHHGNFFQKKVKDSEVKIKDLVESLGITRQYLYVLYGKEKIDDDTRKKVASILNFPVEDFDKEQYKDNTFSENLEQVIVEKDRLIENLEKQNAFMQQQLQFLQNLVQNQMGELKTLLMTREMSSSSVGKWADSEREATTVEATSKAIGERHHDALPTAVKVNQ